MYPGLIKKPLPLVVLTTQSRSGKPQKNKVNSKSKLPCINFINRVLRVSSEEGEKIEN